MIGKLLGIVTSLLVSLCIATLIAEAILAVYYTRTWQLNRQKLLEMLAIAQGADLSVLAGGPPAEPEKPSTEQPSYSEILEARALKARDLDLREQALRATLETLQSERRQVAEERRRTQKSKESFHEELAALEKGAVAAGRDDARRTLETMKPKQAKEQIALMLEKNEIEDVVTLLQGMSESPRAKIIAQFKTTTEAEQIAEVLRRIRQGSPASSMAENTQQQIGQTTAKPLEPNPSPGP